ncbi:MAG: hypothetical protein C4522_02695 [Desulfobacteraceae bacterium]|nr:MAG: hypothetical protein C4522_02695 [Desulfobacteraceae bacterium]
MTPLEIKIALMCAGISQSEIARRCNVKPPQVHRVVNGDVSDNVRREIAAAIKKDVKEIWPEYYLRNALSA